METNAPLTFRPATKVNAKLRLAFIGPAGSGKSYSALAVGCALVPKGRVAAIDTERGSLSKYAKDFAFDVLELEQHSPADYIRAIHAAEQAGYDVLIIDSLSHAWAGKGGALEMVDQIARKSQSGNSFGAWRNVTPHHNALVDTLIGAKLHIIATMRAKTEWVVEKDERTGKQTPRKIGLAPVQRDGMEYEFDVVGDIDQQHSFLVSKSRCSSIADALIEKPGAALAATLREWLVGEPAVERPRPPMPATPAQPAAQPTQAPAAPEPEAPQSEAPSPMGALDGILASFAQAADEAQLLEAGAAVKAAKLPRAEAAVARKAYAKRQEEIRAAALVAADRKLIDEALRDKTAAEPLINYAGSIGIDLSEGLDLEPADLVQLAGWLRAESI